MQLIDSIHIKNRQVAERALRPLDMTYPQLGTLMALHLGDGITQRELADALETDKTTVTVLCDSLEKKGWLKRTPDATDRRMKRIVLTESGRNAYSRALERLETEHEYMENRVSAAELERTIPFLEDLHRNVNGLLQRKDARRSRPRTADLKE